LQNIVKKPLSDLPRVYSFVGLRWLHIQIIP